MDLENSILRWPFSPNWSILHRVSMIPVNFPTGFLVELDERIKNLDFRMWRCKGPRITKTETRTKSETHHLISGLTRQLGFGIKQAPVRWIGNGCPEIDSHIYSPLVFNRRAKVIHWGEYQIFKKLFGNNWIAHRGNKQWTFDTVP